MSWARGTKRCFDLCVASTALCVFAPLIFLLTILVRCKLGSPVFFVQTRPGKNAKPFAMIKFRTMRTQLPGGPQEDHERLTQFGRVLRTWSLDELPELWNVLKGEMSIVGPRPLLMEYLPLYSPAQMRRHEVRPGITGWAQVNGRNALSWPERLALDVWYVDNWSLLLDVRIVWLTAKKVLGCEGISHPGHATMPDFTGERKE